MKLSLRITFAILLFSCLNAFSQKSPTNTVDILSSIRDKYSLPCLAIEVVKEGKALDRAAVGIRKFGSDEPVTTNDIFHLGSCTKQMTAVLTGMFIDEGKLRWDSTIIEVLPELKGKIQQAYENVTVLQLLQHRAGLPTQPPEAARVQAMKELGTPIERRLEFIEAALQEPPAAEAGTNMIYSNQGYIVIGCMLEKISGMDFETLITEKLFKPLGMDSVGFGSVGPMGRIDQPWGHIMREGKLVQTQGDNPSVYDPAGRVHCTLDDFAKFVTFEMEGEKKDGLIKAATMKKLHEPPAGGDYACGLFVVKRSWAGGRAFNHAGSNTMWYVLVWMAPEKDFAVIAATNIALPDTQKACDDVVSAMINKWVKN